jgi:hypothetical protein
MGQKVRDRQLAVLESCDRANAKIRQERLAAAAAAPDMLATLRDIAEYDFPDMPLETARKIREKALAAIAQATR